MAKRHVPMFSVALYSLSALLTVYAAWAFYHSYRYITEVTSSGQLVSSGNEFDIANFYMSNSIQYAIYAVLLFSAGWIARRPSLASEPSPAEAVSVHRKEKDEELEAWFDELRRME
ncbi:hypothetical protein FE782_28390 [Paenibacillus antri]|uniref:Uncharacterized protein n=1 Tax=Paenibacillus antri TaxID=2582848 RepID=A0A5R9G850_9BACL|nr:hypothetical protein [Paenibacillus antri]TLS48923.1 hypothetical protein FE782_28390 [Paenibacillus antri]